MQGVPRPEMTWETNSSNHALTIQNVLANLSPCRLQSAPETSIISTNRKYQARFGVFVVEFSLQTLKMSPTASNPNKKQKQFILILFVVLASISVRNTAKRQNWSPNLHLACKRKLFNQIQQYLAQIAQFCNFLSFWWQFDQICIILMFLCNCRCKSIQNGKIWLKSTKRKQFNQIQQNSLNFMIVRRFCKF